MVFQDSRKGGNSTDGGWQSTLCHSFLCNTGHTRAYIVSGMRISDDFLQIDLTKVNVIKLIATLKDSCKENLE